MASPSPDAPALLTFDIFGTVLDWRTGLSNACAEAGRPLADGEFDRLLDIQGRLEQGAFQDYAAITRDSLVEAIGLDPDAASAIGRDVGLWPLYGDAETLRDLMAIAPCAAMTNSDRSHGDDIQARLGFRLTDWLCAEEARRYKPDPHFWRLMAERRGIRPGPDWWHVSSYADYDLETATALGLTTVFVARPHARSGPATHQVVGLQDLLRLLS